MNQIVSLLEKVIIASAANVSVSVGQCPHQAHVTNNVR